MNAHISMRTFTGFAVALVLAACSGGSSLGSPAASYPAFTPTVPQLQKGSLPAISAPLLVPVYFPGETLQASLDGALSSWVSSSAVFQAMGEYGVTSGRIGPSIAQTGTTTTKAPKGTRTEAVATVAGLTGADVQAWLAGELDGTHPEFGPVDAQTLASKIFVLLYPEATTITFGAASSCTDFGSYDAGVTLATGAVANYVVAPRCAPPDGVSLTDWTVFNATGSIVDRIGSPVPSLSSSASGLGGFDYAHAAFGAYGSEVGTACTVGAVNPGALPGRPFSLVTRVWSNAAAAAYHDPCVPAPSGAYFVSVPDVNDPVSVPPAGVFSRGVFLRVGQSKTIDVNLMSDGPTSGPWTVSTQLLDFTSGFTFVFDNDTGDNGDTLHLTVTAPATPRTDVVVLYSQLGDRRSFWLLPLQSM